MAKSAVFFVFLMFACLMVLSVNAQSFTDHEGKPCFCGTTDNLRHVCGSDGKTYVNKSALECERKCKRSSLEVRYRGQCKPE